jgi:hypothetical protein
MVEMGSKNSKPITTKEVSKIREIIVSENFEIKNGLLGLERDSYLRIVEFLGSSIIRKV